VKKNSPASWKAPDRTAPSLFLIVRIREKSEKFKNKKQFNKKAEKIWGKTKRYQKIDV
jgi:hypothetical protein